MRPQLHICIPILNEFVNLPDFAQCLRDQSYKEFRLYACVNQPDIWWSDIEKSPICEDNAKSLKYLKEIDDFQIEIIDRSSQGNGWIGKKNGVGWARKIAMDLAANSDNPKDIIVSVDADTTYPPNYFQSLIDIFEKQPQIAAHSNPYYHPLCGRLAEDQAILRYELYMRVYALNMLKIKNPYAFSAIGSGMATSVFQYNRVGGISPKHSGEDFYFIQRMSKSGQLSNYNAIKVFPQARFSNRVNFGTGPAMIKGNSGDWSSYPFYSPSLFRQVEETYQSFGDLFYGDQSTPMTQFLQKQLKREDIWGALRKNFKKKELFVRACTELVDGLRILQFVKESHSQKIYNENDDEADFLENLRFFASSDKKLHTFLSEIGFSASPLTFENMKMFRDILTALEYQLRKLNSN